MKRIFISVLLVMHFAATAQAQMQKFRFTQNKMGSPFNLILVAPDSLSAALAAEKSFALVDSLTHLFSDYESNSELSFISDHAALGPVKVSPALWDILSKSKHAYENSLHSFDISVGALSRLWRSCRKRHIFPDSATVAEAQKITGFDKVLMNDSDHSIQFLQAGLRLDLGGIAKGYTAEAVVRRLTEMGIGTALADAGGDIYMSAAPAISGTQDHPKKNTTLAELQEKPGLKESTGWKVGVNIPETTDDLLKRTLSLQNRAVATSGDVYQFIEHDGKKYSHIIDPQTGYGVSFQQNVTIIAKDGATADWLATACSIVPFRMAKKIVRRQDAELLIGTIKNGKLRLQQTRGFGQYWTKPD